MAIRQVLTKLTFASALMLAATSNIFATCYVGCSAVCDSICHYELSGTCTDQEAYYLIRHCCDDAVLVPGLPPCEDGPQN